LAHIAYFDPFVDWAITLATAREEFTEQEDMYLPVFIESESRTELNELIGEVFGERARDALLQERTSIFAQEDSEQISSFFFTSPADFRDLIANEGLREYVQGVGIPLKRKEPDERFELESSQILVDRPPIVAVIDEGVGYLNSRFRKFEVGDGADDEPVQRTRFLALWQQSVRARQENGKAEFIEVGRVLTPADIENDLASLNSKTEFDVYRARNEEIFDDRSHRSTEQSFSHGTAVLDLAAGTEIEEGTEAPDILAVQLPPETLEDTSGTQLPVFLLMGLDWLLSRAAIARRRIIINVSLGFSAGTKTGNALLEKILRNRVDNFNNILAGEDLAAQIVFAYGNSHRERLAARFDLDDKKKEASINWDVQPDDPTPSFLQIHLHGSEAEIHGEIALELTSPRGERFTTLPILHEYEDLNVTLEGQQEEGQDMLVGRIYQDNIEGTPRVTIALAPTRRPTTDKGLWAESGSWNVRVIRHATAPVSVLLQVQRDDTAAGFAFGGRQSVLDHPNGYELDPRTQNFELPDGGPGLTRKGTNSAMMAKGGPAIHLVGSVEPHSYGTAGQVRPTRESPASDDWSTHSTVSEDGFGSPGVLASGTFSDTTVLVDGTSVAAAKLTRALSQGPLNSTPKSAAPRSDRIGQVVVVNGAARPRHP